MHFNRKLSKAVLIAVTLTIPATGFAQSVETRQEQLAQTRSTVQKAGLVTLGLTAATGAILMVNKPTLFSDGLCRQEKGIGGAFGCGGGLTLVHLAFALSSATLFVAQEILAEQMNPNPYYVGDASKQSAMQTLRWTTIGLYAAQPILGFLAAHPQLLGIPGEHRMAVAKWLRTIHFAVGVGIGGTYAANAALQW